MKVIVSADFAQIEARVLAWLAGQKDLLALFAADGPIYEVMASKIYRKPINKKDHPRERQLGKTAILGCFEADTVVLTSSGPKCIVDVGAMDLVWDGGAWVRHGGLMYRGRRRTVRLLGVGVTPDHRVLVGEQWCTVAHLGRDEQDLSRALETASANLRWSGSSPENAGAHCPSGSAARVEPPSTQLTFTTSERGQRLGATPALRPKPTKLESGTGGTQTSFRTTATGRGCSTGYPLVSAVATGRQTLITDTMVGGASGFTPLGEPTGGFFWSIWSRLADGMCRRWNSIGRMLTKGTNPATSDLSVGPRTSRTKEMWGHCRTELRLSRERYGVFDLLFAGPNERFTILTDRGPLLVHNCGFGMGATKFQATCKKQGIAIDAELAQTTIDTYRESNPRIKALWYSTEEAAIRAVENPGTVAACAGGRVKYKVAGSFLWCMLPSGRCLCYPYPVVVDVIKPWGETGPELRYKGVNSYTRKWEVIDTYGGKLVENYTQAVARDLMAEAMLRVEKAGYPVVLTVHDELVSERDREGASVEEYERLMAEVPPWAAGCPIKAEGWIGERYRK